MNAEAVALLLHQIHIWICAAMCRIPLFRNSVSSIVILVGYFYMFDVEIRLYTYEHTHFHMNMHKLLAIKLRRSRRLIDVQLCCCSFRSHSNMELLWKLGNSLIFAWREVCTHTHIHIYVIHVLVMLQFQWLLDCPPPNVACHCNLWLWCGARLERVN